MNKPDEDQPRTLLGVVQDKGVIRDTYLRIAQDETEDDERRRLARLAYNNAKRDTDA